jgi:hypothetical protein
MTWKVRTAAALAALSTLVALWATGGLMAVVCLLLIAATSVPGLPIGFALFGRRHAAGWVAGSLIGYAMSGLSFWAASYVAASWGLQYVAAWAVTSIVVWMVWGRRGRGPVVALPAWTPRATLALLLTLLLVPAVVGRPFANIGTHDADGNRLYRAYFTADFVWHTALVAEMTKGAHPPRNPYLASQPIHYYWPYFLVPATIAGASPIDDVELVLQVTATAVSLLFVSAIYLAAWTALPAYPLVVAAAVALTATAASIEGLAATVDLIRRGRPLAELREYNVDAIAAWAFGGLRIDNLPRSMWYTPQHSAAFALGLLALLVAMAAGVRARPAAIAIAGLALGFSVMFNPFVGALLCALYGVTVLSDAYRTSAPWSGVLRHALAVIPVLAALGWAALNQIADGAGGAVRFGLLGPARNQPIVTFLLSFGPVLVLAIAGVWKSDIVPLRPLATAAAGVVLAVLVMHLITLDVDLFWVGFRGGTLLLVMVPALVARGLVLLRSGVPRSLAAATVAGVLAAGLPTTVIDAYNAQDVGNRLMGPGFHWTVVLSPAEQEALDWLRRETPRDAIVQAEPIVRGRETWSLIPSFAERRMAAGLPISLLHVPEYDRLSARVRDIYAGADAPTAHQTARALAIDYLYVDRTERQAYPATAKFDAHPEYFERVFHNAEVSIYAVK